MKNIIKFFGKYKKILLFLFIFCAVFAVYLLTLFPTLPDEDAGELVTASYFLGIAHPPGYPIYTLLGKLFTLIIPFGSIAWRVNVMSAFFGALSVSLIFLIIDRLTKRSLLGVFTAFLFAFGNIVWSQANRTEVYTLNLFFLVLLIYLALIWLEYHEKSKRSFVAKVKAKRILYVFCLLYGLSLTNHHLMFLAGPPFAFFFIFYNRKILLDWKFLMKGFLLFLAGLSIYLYLPLRSLANPPMDWGNPETLQTFWAHVTRKAYKDLVIIPEKIPTSVKEVAPSVADTLESARYSFVMRVRDIVVNDVYNFFRQFTKLFVEDFFLPTMFFAIIGFYGFYKYHKRFSLLVFALIVFYTSVLSYLIGLGYFKAPMNIFLDRPFFIVGQFLFILIAGVGVEALLKFCERIKKISLSVKKIILPAFLIIPLLGLIFHYEQNDQSNNYIAYDIAKAQLEFPPQDSVVFFVQGDNTIFPVLYLNRVEELRPDLRIYMFVYVNLYELFPGPERVFENNPGKRVFIDLPFGEYRGYGFNYLGYLSEIIPLDKWNKEEVLKNREQALEYVKKVKIRGLDNVNLDFFHRYLVAMDMIHKGLAYHQIDNKARDLLFSSVYTNYPEHSGLFDILFGEFYYRNKEFAKAIPFLERVALSHPRDFTPIYYLGIAHLTMGETAKSSFYLQQAERGNPRLFYLSFADFLAGHGFIDMAIDNLKKALQSSPLDREIMFNIGNLYAGEKKFEDAVNWYEQIVKIDPANADAYLSIGNILLDLKKYKQALEYFRKVEEVAAEDSRLKISVKLNIASVYYSQKRYTDAVHELEELLIKQPDFEPAKEFLRRIRGS